MLDELSSMYMCDGGERAAITVPYNMAGQV